jgi:hypothetical protein
MKSCTSCSMVLALAAAPAARAGVLATLALCFTSLAPVPAHAGWGFVDAGVSISAAGLTAFGDYDNDGDLDLVASGIAGSATGLYRNDGGTFTAVASGLPAGVGSVAWGDYDRDGDLDLAVAVSAETPAIWRNEGNDTFVDAGFAVPGASLSAVGWADIDRDGDLDLVVTGRAGDTPTTRLWLNQGAAFADAGAGLQGVERSALAWGDYDADGDPDLALMGTTTGFAPFTRVYRNTGSSFADEGSALDQVHFGEISWADYDSDGDLDLLVSGNDGIYGPFSRIFRRYASGSLSDEVFLTRIEGASRLVDYDNDGDADVVLNGVPVGTNYPSAFTSDNPVFGTGSANPMPGIWYAKIAFGDADNDGDLDYFVSGLGSQMGRNIGALANQPPSSPSDLALVVGPTLVTFSWSAATDDHTAAPALSYNIRLGSAPGQGDYVPAMSSASGFRRVPAPGNAGARLSYSIARAALTGPVYWSVQAIDGAFKGSAFAPEQSTVLDVPGRPGFSTLALAVWPNPALASTRLAWQQPAAARVELSIHDPSGRRVVTLLDSERGAGRYEVTWNGRASDGSRVGAGVYFARIAAGGSTATTRVLRIE